MLKIRRMTSAIMPSEPLNMPVAEFKAERSGMVGTLSVCRLIVGIISTSKAAV